MGMWGWVCRNRYVFNHAHLLHHNLLPKLIKKQQSCVTLTVLDCDVEDEHD